MAHVQIRLVTHCPCLRIPSVLQHLLSHGAFINEEFLERMSLFGDKRSGLSLLYFEEL